MYIYICYKKSISKIEHIIYIHIYNILQYYTDAVIYIYTLGYIYINAKCHLGKFVIHVYI